MSLSKRSSFLAAAAGALALAGVVSPAAAAYGHPKKAEKLSAEFVTAYNECTAPNLTHREGLALPACVPVASSSNDPTNITTFSRKGMASATITTMADDYSIRIVVRGVLNNGVPYTGGRFDGTGLRARIGVRQTDSRCNSEATPSIYDQGCTVGDFRLMWLPIVVSCVDGACDLLTRASEIVDDPIRRGDLSNIELGAIELLDPDGDAFARQGLYMRRKSGPAATGFGHPDRARRMSIRFVTAFEPCTAPTTFHAQPLTSPGCTPVAASSTGGTTMAFSNRATTSRTDYASGELNVHSRDISLSFQAGGLFVGGQPVSGNVVASAPIRITDAGCGENPPETACTTVNSSLALNLNCVANAVTNVCRGATSTKTLLPGLQVADGPNIEIGQMTLLDAEGDHFARQGIYVP